MKDFNFVNFDASSQSIEDIPPRTGDITKIHIKEKLKQIDISLESDISLGEFDQIGEFTAKKARGEESEHFKNVGAFFRPNYERGILIHSLIRKFNIKSYLEIGFGRGYSCLCAARAMAQNGGGRVATVDPALDEKFLEQLTSIFPAEWFKLIEFYKSTSAEMLGRVKDRFDFIYIDGDHTYPGVKTDWDLTKDRYNKFLLFDDYHMPEIVQKDISCANLIDSIEDKSKELIIMDRRIFFDDRRIPDDEIKYGQVLLTREE